MTIDEIRAKTGDLIGTTSWLTIDQRRIDAFADITEDHQYIHVDAERAAKESPFKTTIAHGYLTLSLLTHFVAQVLPGIDGLGTQINYGLNRVRFLNPVRAGSRVRAHVTLHSVTERRAGEYMVECDISVEIEGEEKPALIARTLGLYL